MPCHEKQVLATTSLFKSLTLSKVQLNTMALQGFPRSRSTTLMSSLLIVISIQLTFTMLPPRAKYRSRPRPKFGSQLTAAHKEDVDENPIEDLVEIPNSCINLDDGLYYIKPTADGPVIPAICSESYTMIDISLNFDAISQYFSSCMCSLPLRDLCQLHCCSLRHIQFRGF